MMLGWNSAWEGERLEGRWRGLEKREQKTQTAEEESELLVIISIPVDMKHYPNCGKLRKAAAK